MSRSARNGNTLTKVLIVIGLVVILIGLMLPAVRHVREPAQRAQCINNLKQIMLALQSFESTQTPAATPALAPPGAMAEHTYPPGCSGPGLTPEERLSWMVELLPYLEQGNLHQRFDFKSGYIGNLQPAQTSVKLFCCRSAKDSATEKAVTHYVAMSGIDFESAAQPPNTAGNGFMGYDRETTDSMITDGTSNTIALLETHYNPGPWARGGESTLRYFGPADKVQSDGRPRFGGHIGSISAAMVDGAVRLLPSSIDPKKLAAAITIAGGERVEFNGY